MKELTINPVEYGIEESKAGELIGNLPQIQSERKILEEQYNEIISLDIEDSETTKRARELRLLIKNNRTKGIEVWHKTTKEFFLKGGQFVDAIKRKEIAINERMESNLESIEKYFENIEKERKSKLNSDRISILEPYNAFVPMGLNFGEISEDEFTKILNGAKLQFEKQQEDERKAEEERIEKERKENLHKERREMILPYWQFVEDKSSVYDLSVLSDEEFENLLQNSITRKSDYEKKQEEIRKENERLNAEKKAIEAKAQKEREEQYKKLKAEQEAKAKLEAELKAKKEAEAKAEKERLAAEEKERKEAEKLAKAPIKKQLNAWISSFEIPNTTIENDKTKLIKAKFEAFKKWSLSEVESM